MSLITKNDYTVHFYEVDNKKRALITSIVNYLMDVCMVQSESQGIGVDYLTKKHIGWILTQWQIKINEYPKYLDKVTAVTKANSFYKFYAYRDNMLENHKGETIVNGRSIWLLVDTDKRRPIRITEDMYSGYGISHNDNERYPIIPLSAPNTWENELKFNVRYSDIDTNNHVNNVKYISWIIESVPMNIASEYIMKEIVITYKKETYYGHTIKVCCSTCKTENGIKCNHVIFNEDGEELTLAETLWETN